MKKLVFIFSILFFSGISAQKKMKDYSDILKSKNIYEINAFLRDAHPDDPRRSVLKPRVMEMMKDYIKNAKPEDQRVREMQKMLALLRSRPSTKITFEEMNAEIKRKQIEYLQNSLKNPTKYVPKAVNISTATIADAAKVEGVSTAAINTAIKSEQAEFDMLINVDPVEHRNRTVKILNSLFDNDPTSKETAIVIENNSDCNMIMRIEGVGNNKYRLAIPAKDKSSIVIAKGDYLFSSLVCGAQYASQKSVQKSIIVSLGNPKK